MDDIEILNQPSDVHPDQLDIEHFILDHNVLCDSMNMLSEIQQHLITINGLGVALEGIALEGLGDTIKEYWARFLAFLKKIWEKIVAFFEAHFTVLGRRRLHIKRMITKVKAISTNPNVYQALDKNKTGLVIKPEHAQSFTIGDRIITGAQELLGAMARTRAAVTVVTDDYAKYIVDRGLKISKTIQSANAQNASGLYTRIVEELNNNAFHIGKTEMLGNVTVAYGAGGEGLDSHRLILTQKPADRDAIYFTPMTVEDLAKVYANMEGVLDEMDTFKNGEYKQIVQGAKSMMTLTDSFVKNVSGLAEGAEGSADSFKHLLELNKHYLNWIKAPTTDLIRQLTTSFFYIGIEMENNINMYDREGAHNLFTIFGLC